MTREFTTERELYDEVVKHLKSGSYFADKIREYNRNVYVVGEEHGSRDPIEYVHKEIVPNMEKYPDKWLMLREGLHSYDGYDAEDLLEDHPSHLYFTKLPQILGISCDDIIGSPTDKDTKSGIVERSNLSGEEVDLWYAVGFINTNRHLGKEAAIKALADRIDKPIEYVLNLPWGRVTNELHESLMVAWNQYGRSRFSQVAEQYSNRENILVSIGQAHLPAISDKY